MIHSRTFIAIPPGETIKEQLSYRGMSQKEFALRMDLSEKHITNLLKGDVGLTPNVAMRLEMVLGISAVFWSNLESIYRQNILKVEEENQMDFDKQILKNIPYTEMMKMGWVPSHKKIYDKIISSRKFFEVSNLQLLNNLQIHHIACRRLSFTEKSDYAVLAWTQKVKLEARKIETKPINISGLKTSISDIRNMTVMNPSEFCPKLKSLLSENGIAIVFLPHLKGSFLHGVSFLDGKKIVVGLTCRGKDADKFWFSLFHELAHVIYGHISKIEEVSAEDELVANKFAGDTLINAQDLSSFINKNNYTEKTLKHFAHSINIDVGILVGRLQNDNVIEQTQFNYLKTKYQIIDDDSNKNQSA